MGSALGAVALAESEAHRFVPREGPAGLPGGGKGGVTQRRTERADPGLMLRLLPGRAPAADALPERLRGAQQTGGALQLGRTCRAVPGAGGSAGPGLGVEHPTRCKTGIV